MQRTPENPSWYVNEDLRNAVNLCMKALEESGVSADEAEMIPDCLAVAIRCSNRISMKQSKFKSTQIGVEFSNGGYDVVPMELLYAGL